MCCPPTRFRSICFEGTAALHAERAAQHAYQEQYGTGQRARVESLGLFSLLRTAAMAVFLCACFLL